jgi:cell division protein ZapA
MPQVSIRINNRIYEVACGEGEEQHLESLSDDINQRIEQLRPQMPGAAEVKLLLAAALTFADEVRELRGGREPVQPLPLPLVAGDPATAPDPSDKLASAFEQLVTARVETIAAKLSAA